MDIKKKVTALAVSLVSVFALSSCGGPDPVAKGYFGVNDSTAFRYKLYDPAASTALDEVSIYSLTSNNKVVTTFNESGKFDPDSVGAVIEDLKSGEKTPFEVSPLDLN